MTLILVCIKRLNLKSDEATKLIKLILILVFRSGPFSAGRSKPRCYRGNEGGECVQLYQVTFIEVEQLQIPTKHSLRTDQINKNIFIELLCISHHLLLRKGNAKKLNDIEHASQREKEERDDEGKPPAGYKRRKKFRKDLK
jgi:hypothetical protein